MSLTDTPRRNTFVDFRVKGKTDFEFDALFFPKSPPHRYRGTMGRRSKDYRFG
jgi:hypothetical protein